MPTYQYRCTSCGEDLEIFQKFTDDPLTECPACSGELRKVFSPVGVVFKGSGFYATDSRQPSRSSSAEKGSGAKDSSTKSTTKEKAASASSSPAKE